MEEVKFPAALFLPTPVVRAGDMNEYCMLGPVSPQRPLQAAGRYSSLPLWEGSVM